MSSRLVPPSFPVEDLGRHASSVVDAARNGVALLQDTEGVSLVVLSAERYAVVTAIADGAMQYLLVEAAIRKPDGERSDIDFGECPWLQAFDDEDLRTFLDEFGTALVATARSRSTSALDRLLTEWRITAQVAADPEAREVLLGAHDLADFVEVDRPE